MRLIMIDKLIVIKEYKLFINRYYKFIINLDNTYKSIKDIIIKNIYSILNDIYYCNLLEVNKRKNYQRKIIVNIKMLDFYFHQLYLYKVITKDHYNNISNNLVIILKLIYGWMK